MKVADEVTNRVAPPLPASAPASVVTPPSGTLASPAIPARKPIKKHRWKKWLLAVVLLSAAAALFLYLRASSNPKTEYVTATVDRGDIESTVTTTGNLNAVITVQVGSQVSGNILALYADFNTKVKKGQLVALIDPAPFQAAVDQATGALNSAKAAVGTAQASLAKSQSDLASSLAIVASQKANVVKAQSAVNLAKVELDRRLVLIRQDATSQEDLDTAKANYEQSLAVVDAAKSAQNAAEAASQSARKAVEVAQALLQQAQANAQQDQAALAQAQLNLDHTRITAPVDGTIQSRNMDIGQTVAASFQAPTIFLIAQDLTKMQVDTNVGEADVSAVRLDQQASFTVDAYPGQVFPGKVAQIRQAPINVQNVITYDVVIAVSNPDLKLFPGMTANATIFTGHASNALRIPKAALRFRLRAATNASSKTVAPAPRSKAVPQAQTIYMLDEQRQPKPIQIKLGLSDANYAQVVGDALQDGDQVIVGAKGLAPAAAAQQPQGGGTRRFGL